jgi:Fuc2NAc and GlcNAc transferase
MQSWWTFPIAVIVSALLTGALRGYAIKKGMMDIPNFRSSHTTPIPRGGGLAIVVTFLSGVAAFVALGQIGMVAAVSIGGAGAIAGTIGYIDDHRHVDARWRLLAHFCAAIWALAWLGGLPPLGVGDTTVNLGWLGHILAAIYLVWMLNLYNFMDGIDGIAGLQGVTVGLGVTTLHLMHTPANAPWHLPALLALATLGFLIWNWPPAKIFMGDVGSGFLGLMVGVMSIQDAWLGPQWLWIWLILLAVFVVDATVTLLRRACNREKIYEAHRSHAYQIAARKIGAHKPVTLIVGAINVLWLFPLALLVFYGWINGLMGILIAYTPLIVAAGLLKAGTDT